MERFFRFSLSLFTILFIAVVITTTGCSDDDNPSDPNPTDTTGNNDTNQTTIDDRVRPVVFVHGFLEAADVYTQMTQLFALNNYTAAQLYPFDLQSYITDTEADIAAMANQIGTQVEAALQAGSETRVDIIAHGIGVTAVQHYIATMNGSEKLAHVVYAGGEYDMSITVNGDITPAPCKYLTLRSDGKDDLQNGNSSYGQLTGATNEVMAGMDNIQLVTAPEAFAKVYRFFTGSAPQKTSFDNPRPGQDYTIRARAIDIIDNTPVAGLNVTAVEIRTLSSGEIQRQSSPESFTTDADGFFTYTANLGPDHHTEFWIRSLTGSHFDMHIYVQPWRQDVQTFRLRMIPKATAGSQLLTQFSSAMRTGDHSIFLVYSQNQALQAGEDDLLLKRFNPALEPIGELSLLTPGNAPAAGVSSTGGNTFMLTVLDYDTNQQDGTGPIQTTGLHGFGMSSFDAYLAGKPSNHQTQVVLNGRTIGVQNFASNGGLGASNGGFTMVHFEY
ncbi:MAG: hypothetical protein JXA28_11660 [Bacteroidetes bacterium]|nr:hypothetical protein [Bacteroidota bacterium]